MRLWEAACLLRGHRWVAPVVPFHYVKAVCTRCGLALPGPTTKRAAGLSGGGER